MPTEEEHQILVNRGRGAIARFWPYAVARNLLLDFTPRVGDEVKAEKVILVLAIVPAENVHAFLINNRRVRVTRCRWRTHSYSN